MKSALTAIATGSYSPEAASNRSPKVEHMADDTLTFAVGGELEIAELQRGINLFYNLVRSMTRGKDVRWLVEDLQAGSATATVRGQAQETADVHAIVATYGAVGDALEQGRPLDFGPSINRPAQAIRRYASTVEFVMLQVAERDYTVYSNGSVQSSKLPVSIGAITGRVQTLSSRGSLRFVVFDSIHDKAVPCFLQPGQESLMMEAWDRRARVSGTISRDPYSFRPVAVRHILNVEILEDPSPGTYRLARGAIERRPGDPMPEEIIRRLRDG